MGEMDRGWPQTLGCTVRMVVVLAVLQELGETCAEREGLWEPSGEVSLTDLTELMGDTLLLVVIGATHVPCELRAVETKADLAEDIEADVVKLAIAPMDTVESFSESEDFESRREKGAHGRRKGPVDTKTGADAEGANETLLSPWAIGVGVLVRLRTSR